MDCWCKRCDIVVVVLAFVLISLVHVYDWTVAVLVGSCPCRCLLSGCGHLVCQEAEGLYCSVCRCSGSDCFSRGDDGSVGGVDGISDGCQGVVSVMLSVGVADGSCQCQ